MLRRQGRGGKFLEEVLIVGGLLLVQCVLSGYVVFTDHLLALGADPLAVVVVAGAAYAAFCFPFAVALERYVRSRFPPQHMNEYDTYDYIMLRTYRKRWPSTVSGTLVAQYLLIALGGYGSPIIRSIHHICFCCCCSFCNSIHPSGQPRFKR